MRNFIKTKPPTISMTVIEITALALAALPLLFTNVPVNAETAYSDLNLNISSVISLVLTNCDASNPESVVLSIDPTATGVFKSNCQNVNVVTNTPGYSLSVKAGNVTDGNSLLYQNSTTLNPLPVIPATGTGTFLSPQVLPNDTWGYAVEDQLNFNDSYATDDASNKYANLPITDQTIYQTDQWPAPITGFKVYYASKLTLATVAGTYKVSITYTAIGEEIPPIPDPIPDYNGQTFADIDPTTCDNTVTISTVFTITDPRNNQDYNIRCMEDGNYWMITNLRIALSDIKSTEPELSNPNVNFVALGDQTTPDNSGSYYYDEPRYYDPTCGAVNDPTTNGYDCDNSDGDITSDHFYGYLYNWCAATGATNSTCTANNVPPTNATTDICPANWRLPTGGNNSDEEFYDLYNAYNGNPASFQFTGPFRSVLAGYWGDSFYDQGYYASLWSASARPSNSGYAFSLFLELGDVYPDSSSGRDGGLAVRCLLRP